MFFGEIGGLRGVYTVHKIGSFYGHKFFFDNFFISFFKTYPEMRTQYFGFLNNLNEEELKRSPRLHSHASGVLLGVSQIINGLENPVRYTLFLIKSIRCIYFKNIC